jgi:hypothetical protein
MQAVFEEPIHLQEEKAELPLHRASLPSPSEALGTGPLVTSSSVSDGELMLTRKTFDFGFVRHTICLTARWKVENEHMHEHSVYFEYLGEKSVMENPIWWVEPRAEGAPCF